MAMQPSRARRIWNRRYTAVPVRIGLGCVVVAGICLAQLATKSGADTAFVPGGATAGTQAVSIAPTTGQLNYAITLATSVADYQNGEAQALSQTLDLGSIGTSLESPSCSDGSPSNIQASDFPAPDQAESTSGTQTLQSSETEKLNATGIGAGNEYASATQTPSGSSTTTITGASLANLVSYGSSTDSAQAAIQNGATRYADATADMSSLSLDNGLVVLSGLHWGATQTSGASQSSTAAFSVSGLTVAGANVPITNDSAATLLQVVNSALSPVGLQVDWPVQSTLPDGTINISPLIVGIDNNALGQEIIGANLGATETVRNAIETDLFNINCNAATVFLLGDIGIGPFAGGGNLNLEFGGAHAETNDQGFVDPFGSASVPPPAVDTAPVLTTPVVTTPAIAGTPGTPAIPATPSLGTTAPTTATTTPSSGQAESLGALSKYDTCHSLSTAGGGCNGPDVAFPVGLAGLALLAGLAGFDYVRQRRRVRLGDLEAR